MKFNHCINLTVLAVASLLTVNPASALVVDSGVDTTVVTYVFGAGSTATYHPSSLIIIGDPSGQGNPQEETRNISGGFEVEFSHYWWQYTLGDSAGSTAITDQYWLRLANPVVAGVSDWAGFALFGSQMQSIGNDYSNLYGDSGACFSPRGPDTYCTGVNNGALSQISGGLVNGLLTLDGTIPLDSFGGSYYAYHLEASPVPIPAAAVLYGSALAGLALLRRFLPT